MLSVILLVLQMLSAVVFGESAIRKYPEGQIVLDKLSKAGLFFLHWRAYADYKSELKQLRNIFGAIAIVFTVIFVINGQSKEPTLLSAMPGIFIILWATMHFGINIKRSLSEQFSMAALLFLAPWIFLLVDYADILPFDHLPMLASPFKIFGILDLENYQIALTLSLIGGLGGVVMAILSSILFSIVPLMFLFLVVSLSVISKALLNISPQKAYYASIIYCIVIGPALILAESKGLL